MVARTSSRMVLESSSGMGRASSRVAPFRRRLGRPSSLARPRLVVRARYEVGREASSALGAMARLTARRLSRSLRHAQEALTQGPFMQDALHRTPFMQDALHAGRPHAEAAHERPRPPDRAAMRAAGRGPLICVGPDILTRMSCTRAKLCVLALDILTARACRSLDGPGKVGLQSNPLSRTLLRQGHGTLDTRASFDMVFDARPIIVGTFPFRIHRPRRFRGCGMR